MSIVISWLSSIMSRAISRFWRHADLFVRLCVAFKVTAMEFAPLHTRLAIIVCTLNPWPLLLQNAWHAPFKRLKCKEICMNETGLKVELASVRCWGNQNAEQEKIGVKRYVYYSVERKQILILSNPIGKLKQMQGTRKYYRVPLWKPADYW